MDRQRHFLVTVAVAVALASCTGSDVPDPRLVDAYTVAMVTRESYKDSTEARSAVRDSLQARGYTVASFEQDVRAVAANPKRYRALMDSVSESLKRRR
jgi:hypothetical protein